MAGRLGSPGARYGVAAGFLFAAFLLGGGARGDIVSLVVLRPLATLAAGYAVLHADAGKVARLGLPFWLLLGLLLTACLQVVPLPHVIWSALPGRGLVVANDRIAGVADAARAISLSPSRTWNTVFALSVPLATMLLIAPLDDRQARRLLYVVYAAAALGALLAVLQMLGPAGGPFRLYRVTNANNPVGLFANRNHFAIFLASVLPLLVFAALASEDNPRRRPLIVAICIGSVLCLVPITLITGSRSGALLMVAALGSSGGLWAAHAAGDTASRRVVDRSRIRRLLPIAAIAGTILAMGMGAFLNSRSAALNRLFEEDLSGELRLRILPQLWNMVAAYFPVGAGFGTFELAYKTFEPFDILRPTYLNQAHDDVIQFVIEGGAIGAILMIGFLLWFARQGVAAWRRIGERRERSHALHVQPFAWTSLAVLLASSVVDYPLRTPAMMAFAALLCCLARTPEPSPRTR